VERAAAVEARRPQLLEAGLFLVVLATPLAFFPLSVSPFVDVKLLVLVLGTLLVWASGIPVDRRLVLPASLWVGALVVATAAGVDPFESLLGVEAGGLAMLGCATALLVVAPSIPAPLVERLRRWLVVCGAIAAAVVLADRLLPDVREALFEDIGFKGSLLGNPLFAAGFLSLAIAAALGRRGGRLAGSSAILALLASGAAVTEERSSIVLPVAALLAGFWYVRPDRRRLLAAAAAVVIPLALWSGPLAEVNSATSARYQVTGQLQTIVGEEQRLIVYASALRGFAHRPVLGWGPANTWSSYVRWTSHEDLASAGRHWGDAHDLVLQTMVMSGVIGLAALIFLMVRVAPGVLLAPRGPEAWTSAGALLLAAYHLFEPVNVTLTPLLFLLSGIALARRAPAVAARGDARGRRVARGLVGVALGLGLVLAGLNLGASALEKWGRSHFAPWAFRASLALQPWRISAAQGLAEDLAVGADEAAAAEARDLVRRTVDLHPWNPGVRLVAADVEHLLGDEAARLEWYRRQLEVFPNDTATPPPEP
jgi:O-antigen ligase